MARGVTVTVATVANICGYISVRGLEDDHDENEHRNNVCADYNTSTYNQWALILVDHWPFLCPSLKSYRYLASVGEGRGGGGG